MTLKEIFKPQSQNDKNVVTFEKLAKAQSKKSELGNEVIVGDRVYFAFIQRPISRENVDTIIETSQEKETEEIPTLDLKMIMILGREVEEYEKNYKFVRMTNFPILQKTS